MVLDRSNISGSLLVGALWLIVVILYGILSYLFSLAMMPHAMHVINGIGLVLNIGILFILYTICQTETVVKRVAFLLGIILTVAAFIISAMTMITPFAFWTILAVSMYVVITIPLLLMGYAMVRDMDSSYQWLGWMIIVLGTIMAWVAVFLWSILGDPNVSILIGQSILLLIAIGILYFLYNRFCQINAGVIKINAFNRDRSE